MFETIFFIIAALFFIGSLDDLIIDIAYALHGMRPKKISTQEWAEWRTQPEKGLAIMVPAWKEATVLESMVKTNLARVDYHNYMWFIGVYPNDIETLSIAKKLERQYPDKVVVVITDRPGPTSKAHCLNCIMQVIQGMSREGILEDGGWIPHYVAIHDAEDVIHPDAFTAINAQSPDLDFIQLPIFSLPVPASEWVSGTYLDEFAEIHLREIPVRKVLKMPIPSAGVGTFFSLEILLRLGKRFGYWFDEENLTEDYEISIRIARLNGKQEFLLIFDENAEIVATREYFPRELGHSIRQKTRWTTGIGLQTMAKWKFYGTWSQGIFQYRNWVTAYAIARDRKALWANPTVMGAWFLILFSAMITFSLAGRAKNHFEFPHLMAAFVVINMVFFGIRILQRARFCAQVYGKRQGLLSFPRVFISTYINSIACFRALYNYVAAKQRHRETRIAWDKTEHRFPTLVSESETKEHTLQ